MTLCNPMNCSTPPCPSPTPGVYPNSCPLSWWYHPTSSSLVIPFFSCLQSFPSSGSFPMSQFFASGGQRIGASVSVLPMTIQGWFTLGWPGWISLQSKGLSRVFSSTAVWKHQFFGAQPSSWSNSDIHTYMTTGKTIALIRRTFVSKVMSLLFNMLSSLVIVFLPGSEYRSSISLLNCPFLARRWVYLAVNELDSRKKCLGFWWELCWPCRLI